MSYSRVCTRAAGLLGLAALASVAVLPALAPAEAEPSYDGLWSVVIVTKAGQCDSGAGSWSGNGNGACSGVWEAERRG